MPRTSLVTASYVTRELGYGRLGEWARGDEATQAWFAPVETYEERFGALLDDIEFLGYRVIDLWGAHLHWAWATEEHFGAARRQLAAKGFEVNSLAAWAHDLASLEGFCRVANEVGADIIAGGTPTLGDERSEAVAILSQSGVRFAIENHPERHPDEVLSVIGDEEWIGACPDTGWWGTQGYPSDEAVRRLAGRILTVHLKDVDEGGAGVRPGDGVARLAETLDALADIAYDGVVGVEHEPDGWDPVGDLRYGFEMVETWKASL